jgi:chemotaxis protein MotB
VVEQKIIRVVGLSSSALFDKKDPYSPMNRRISLIVMNKQTEEALSKDSIATVSVDADGDTEAEPPKE